MNRHKQGTSKNVAWMKAEELNGLIEQCREKGISTSSWYVEVEEPGHVKVHFKQEEVTDNLNI